MIDIHLARQDRAVGATGEDDLDRGPFIASLVSALVDDVDESGPRPIRRATGFVVGLTGEWGLGKSSVLNLLEEKLGSMNQVIVTHFNPWLFKGRDELVQGYFNALRRALGKSTQENVQDALKALDKYRSAIEKAGTKGALVIDAHGASGFATVIWKGVNWFLGLFGPAPPKTPDEERASLEKKLEATRCAVVVLIDELDRIEDDEVRAVAQLVKAVGDIKGISYLVAYDPKRVAEALGRGSGEERRISGEAYLEKIVQMPIPLRPLFHDDVKALLLAALRRYGFDLPEPRSQEPNAHELSIFNELLNSVRTPREVKRLAGSFVAFERMVRGEICVWDVLGYSWLASKTPSLRDRIAAKLNAMISDPPQEEMIRRIHLLDTDGKTRKIETVKDVLGVDVTGHEGMLNVIFPRFLEKSENPSGSRLARRRNLTRLLYLGNPPGLISRVEIEKTWNLNGHDLREILERYKSEGRVGVLLDRLDDLLPELPTKGDAEFWHVLSATLLRPADWAQGENDARDLIEDAATSIWRLGSANKGGADRVLNTFEGLVAKGDLLIAPWLLRKHLFAHGLCIHSTSSRENYIFDLAKTQELLEREVPRYREALASGFALRRLPDNEAMYVLLNSGNFDEDLRQKFTQQMSSMDAIASFAVITVPPGYVAEKSSLNQLIDADAVLANIIKMKAEGVMPAAPYLRISVRRLEATLAGRNTHFMEADDEG
jgi:hypothetical protein